MITIRTATKDDLEALVHIYKTAYNIEKPNQGILERNFRIQPDGTFLAHLHGEPVGMVSLFVYSSFASVGTLGVLPEARGSGVGRQLMEQAEALGKRKGVLGLVLDATHDGARLYEKMGYADADTVQQFKLGGTISVVSNHARVRAVKPNDLADLITFDAHIFGARRERVLETLFQTFPSSAFLAHDEGQLTGFMLSHGGTLGPWSAVSVQVAEELLRTALSLEPVNARVLIPSKNQAGIELLQRYGFESVRTLRHMVKGEIPQRQRQNIYGQASYALG
jgi:ribosomal protein S18 acetylase RimI-like enzyme